MIRASVVIPARGRSEILARAVRLFDAQRGLAPGAFETIVVADHCPATVQTVAGLDLAHPCRLLEIPGDPDSPFGAAEARNAGARFAQGELLIFVDADCLPAPDHVSGFLSVFEPETLLIGPIDFVDVEDWTKPLAPESRGAFVLGTRPPDGVDARVWLAAQCWTGNMAIERRAFLELGGFDLDFVGAGGEDVDFGLRCLARFGRVAKAPGRVRHVGPTAAFAHARGEPGPLEDGGVSAGIASGRYDRNGDGGAANGGEAHFDGGPRWEGLRDLRAARSGRGLYEAEVASPEAEVASPEAEVASPEAEVASPEAEVASPEPEASPADVFQAQLERSAAALVAIARRLDRARPLDGGEAEFLSLYAGVVAADPASFSRVWSDPQAHGWVKAAFGALERVVQGGGSDARAALGTAIDRFAPFALACAHLSGERRMLTQGHRFRGNLALPGTAFTLEAEAEAELRGVDGTRVLVARPGDAGPGRPLDLRHGAEAAGVRVAVCPTLDWNGQRIRFQPSAFRGAEGETGAYVVDAGPELQSAHLSVLRGALDLLTRFSADTAALAEWLQLVAFNRPGVADLGNTSSTERPGGVAMIATDDAWELAETLVHELHHQRLFAVEIEGPLFSDEAQNEGRDFLHYSPWRIEPRPIKGLLHAYYVFVAVAHYWLVVLERSESDEGAGRAQARGRLSILSLQLPIVLERIRAAARFSPLGERVFHETEARLRAVLAEIAEAGLSGEGTEAERTVEAHADQFDSPRVLARIAPTLSYEARSATARAGAAAATGRVSALCVTRGRVAYLERTVRCFLAQTHPDRELVIVHDDDDLETAAFVDGLARSTPEVVSVRVPREPRRPLGELRNLAVASSSGEYVCQWDDDDWHHPERIATQLLALRRAEGKAACVLSRWTVFDEARGRAYLSPYRQWEGSLLCRRDGLPAYPALAIGEDTPVIEALRVAGRLVALERPELYVYVAHGGNTFPASHFETYYEASLWLGPDRSAEVAEALAKAAA